MKAFGYSDNGMLRAENEDSFALIPLSSPDDLLAVVCDGMGGAKGGGDAARLCADVFKERFSHAAIPERSELEAALTCANDRVLARAAETGHSRMGTTVVAAVATPACVSVRWLGDSRAYLWHKGTLQRLTRDHSYVQTLIDEGKIGEEEARTHIHRHLITRAVGVNGEAEGEYRTFSWDAGDRLLLCSDGLSSMVSARELCEIMAEDQPPAHTVHELISAANSHGGEDNITALVLENTKETTFDA